MQLIQETIIPPSDYPNHAPAAQGYPSSGYFQSHFERLYEIIGHLQQHLNDTHQRMALLQQRLDSLDQLTHPAIEGLPHPEKGEAFKVMERDAA